MSFTAPIGFESLKGKEKKADGECVRLLQEIIHNMPVTAKWRAGAKVKGNLNIPKGTAIATFFNGRYPSARHGNHAALYVGQDEKGIWVIDQFNDERKKFQKINKRPLRFGAPYSSNNGDLFYVIETETSLAHK